MKVTGLFVYPVKSFRGIAMQQAKLGIRGLDFDRWWMLVDRQGHFVSQRQLPAMATVSVALSESCLSLFHSDLPELHLSLEPPTTPPMPVKIWRDTCLAHDEGRLVSRWLSRALGEYGGTELRLVRFHEPQRRPVDAKYLGDEDSHTAFADGFPYLVTSEESLHQLNEALRHRGESAVPMGRFRPNIVVQGAVAFAEDGLDTLRCDDYELGLRKPCKRCKVTTLDPLTGVAPSPPEPLRTLLELRDQPKPGGVYFGQNAILLRGSGRAIHVGDVLEPKL